MINAQMVVEAGAVVLATGGFAGSPDAIAMHAPEIKRSLPIFASTNSPEVRRIIFELIHGNSFFFFYKFNSIHFSKQPCGNHIYILCNVVVSIRGEGERGWPRCRY